MLEALAVLTLEPRSVHVLLNAATMGHPLLPATFIRNATLFHDLALTLALTLHKFTLIDVTRRRHLLARTLGDPVLPRAIILLPARHHHLPLAMSLAILKLPLINVSILQRQFPTTMRSAIALRPEIHITLRRPNLSLLSASFSHLIFFQLILISCCCPIHICCLGFWGL